MGMFGFDSVADAFDGGGAGNSGGGYSTAGMSWGGGGGNPSGPDGSVRPVSRPHIEVSSDGGSYTTSRDDTNAASFAQLNPAAAQGNFSEYAPGTVNPRNNMVQRYVQNHPYSRGIAALTGTNIKNDQVVNIVDGNPVRESKRGDLYALNPLGMPYSLASIDSLDEDPAQIAMRDTPGLGERSEAMTESSYNADPCPEGYVYDPEQLMCVMDTMGYGMGDIMDPVVRPSTPVAPSNYSTPDPMNVSPGGNPGYTQPMGNFIPTPLQPNPINPLQQQLSRLSRSISGPQQQGPQRRGLSAANTGIMQARP